MGRPLHFIVKGEECDDKYSLCFGALPPGAGPPPHIHERDGEGFFVLGGQGLFNVGLKSLEVESGSFVYAPPGSPHSFKNTGKEPLRILVIDVPSVFDKFVERVGSKLENPEHPCKEVTAEDYQRLAKIAPEFGIQMLAPDQQFEIDYPYIHRGPTEGHMWVALGTNYRCLLSSEESQGACSLWHVWLPPNSFRTFHGHFGKHCSYFILNGSLNFLLEGSEMISQPGEFFQFPPEYSQCLGNPHDEPVSFLLLLTPGISQEHLQKEVAPEGFEDDLDSPLTKAYMDIVNLVLVLDNLFLQPGKLDPEPFRMIFERLQVYDQMFRKMLGSRPEDLEKLGMKMSEKDEEKLSLILKLVDQNKKKGLRKDFPFPDLIEELYDED